MTEMTPKEKIEEIRPFVNLINEGLPTSHIYYNLGHCVPLLLSLLDEAVGVIKDLMQEYSNDLISEFGTHSNPNPTSASIEKSRDFLNKLEGKGE